MLLAIQRATNIAYYRHFHTSLATAVSYDETPCHHKETDQSLRHFFSHVSVWKKLGTNRLGSLSSQAGRLLMSAWTLFARCRTWLPRCPKEGLGASNFSLDTTMPPKYDVVARLWARVVITFCRPHRHCRMVTSRRYSKRHGNLDLRFCTSVT